jgi:hypothetical protein
MIRRWLQSELIGVRHVCLLSSGVARHFYEDADDVASLNATMTLIRAFSKQAVTIVIEFHLRRLISDAEIYKFAYCFAFLL